VANISNTNLENSPNQLPIISEKILQRLINYHKETLYGVVRISMERLSKNYLDLTRSRELFQRLSVYLPQSPGNILEIGSGCGQFVAYASRWGGHNAFGIEPDSVYISICGEVQKELGTPADHLLQSVGEQLPFSSNSMDLVTSVTVFEHVSNPSMVLKESIRVLKPGGFLHFTFPNYGSWWDGHYAILWFPNMTKKLAKFYVRLLGRKPEYLDGLQLLNFKRLKSLVADLGDKVEVLDYGEKIWEDRLRNSNFQNYGHLETLKMWVGILQKLKLVELVIGIGKLVHWETPFVLILRKK
jgi:ubiquinone/menaquinone biosynthesis C-methylase UbiE